MTKPVTILKNDPSFSEELDFGQLRVEGITHIAELSGLVWSDHNVHDPGITILDVLIYALIDLKYRNTLKTEELLAPVKKPKVGDDNFLTPAEILSCNPVTILDYRKLLIDIEGVRNAWLEVADDHEVDLYVNINAIGPGQDCPDSFLQYGPIDNRKVVLNGLYKVYLELDSFRPQDRTIDACGNERVPVDRILAEVHEVLHSHRNLCEDFLDIQILEDEEIGICTDIELEPDADPEDVMVDILANIQEFLSPSLQFYTLQELLTDKNKTIEEAFAGRPLILENSHGFVDVDELEALELKREIHVSDLYREIMKVKGVRAIQELKIFSYIDGECHSGAEEWCLNLTEGHRPVLAFSSDKSVFRFHKGILQFAADFQEVEDRFEKRLSDLQKAKLPAENLNYSIPYGKHRDDLGDYLSIQNDFPLTYRIGEGEMPEGATPERKARALQLKGYLLFFDQVFANYLSQLENVRHLFSMTPDSQRDQSQQRSYFSQSLVNVPDIQRLLLFFEDEQQSDFTPNEVLAVSAIHYRFPARRDIAIENLIALIEENEVTVEAIEESGNYYFVIQDLDTSEVLLRG